MREKSRCCSISLFNNNSNNNNTKLDATRYRGMGCYEVNGKERSISLFNNNSNNNNTKLDATRYRGMGCYEVNGKERSISLFNNNSNNNNTKLDATRYRGMGCFEVNGKERSISLLDNNRGLTRRLSRKRKLVVSSGSSGHASQVLNQRPILSVGRSTATVVVVGVKANMGNVVLTLVLQDAVGAELELFGKFGFHHGLGTEVAMGCAQTTKTWRGQRGVRSK
jgi:hypothetical protein